MTDDPGQAPSRRRGTSRLPRGSCHRPQTAPATGSDCFPSMFRRSFLRIMQDPPRLSPPWAGRVPPSTGPCCFPGMFRSARDALIRCGAAGQSPPTASPACFAGVSCESCRIRPAWRPPGPTGCRGRPAACWLPGTYRSACDAAQRARGFRLLPQHVSQEFPANHAGTVPPVSAPGPPGAADDLQPGNHAGCLKTVSNFPCLDRFRSASFQNALVDSAQDKRSASCGGGRGDPKCFRKRSRFVAAGTAAPGISAPVRPSTPTCAAGW